MSNFRTVLVAADFSERSQEAFRVACSLTEETGTRVIVLHVVEPPVAVGDMGSLIRSPRPVPRSERH